MNTERLTQQIDAIPLTVAHDLEKALSKHFDKAGLFYRIFSRCKSGSSAATKLIEKETEYLEKGKKMQDLIGVRVALYFKDDIDLCINIIKTCFATIDIVRDEEQSDTFKPMRLNIVCSMPEKTIMQLDPELWEYLIDKTFEIQVRTIFSEGWHEVEHDLRYKHKQDWLEHIELSRNLNGIFATLETCDWAILNVVEELAYQKYRSGNWEAMLRNHFRIRLDSTPLSDTLIRIFNSNHEIAKDFLKVDRQIILLSLSSPDIRPFPKNVNNLVYLSNELTIHNPEIDKVTPPFFKSLLTYLK